MSACTACRADIWPGETLTLPAIPAKIVHGEALTGSAVTIKQTDRLIEVTLPARHRHEIDTIIALELDRPASGIAPVSMLNASHSLATGKRATASNVYRNMAQFGPGKAFDDNSETRWATDSGTMSAWLEVDLGKPVTIGRAVIEQAFPELQRVRKFAIEYWQDGSWRPCYQGENLGDTLEVTFRPITAQRVRLNIIEASDGPTIWEFELYPPKKSNLPNSKRNSVRNPPYFWHWFCGAIKRAAEESGTDGTLLGADRTATTPIKPTFVRTSSLASAVGCRASQMCLDPPVANPLAAPRSSAALRPYLSVDRFCWPGSVRQKAARPTSLDQLQGYCKWKMPDDIRGEIHRFSSAWRLADDGVVVHCLQVDRCPGGHRHGGHTYPVGQASENHHHLSLDISRPPVLAPRISDGHSLPGRVFGSKVRWMGRNPSRECKLSGLRSCRR